MSSQWYPVIDYTLCTECGVCVNKCKNGVYSPDSHTKPVVVYGDGCIDQCRGCQNLCPAQAIRYYGDTGQAEKACCRN